MNLKTSVFRVRTLCVCLSAEGLCASILCPPHRVCREVKGEAMCMCKERCPSSYNPVSTATEHFEVFAVACITVVVPLRTM